MVNKETLSLLQRLKHADRPVSGAALAREFGVSRVALWKRFEALRAAGYEVCADRAGYRLEPTDKPLPWEFPGDEGTVFHFDSLASTMDEASRLGLEGLAEGAVVAETQSLGRGRAQRRWESAGGDLLVTLLVRPALPLSFVGALGLEALACLAETLAALYNLNLSLKWPNDLMAGPDKVAGMLVEAFGPSDQPRFYTVGLGLNVHTVPTLDRPAASVASLGRPEADRRAILALWRHKLTAWVREPRPEPARWAALSSPFSPVSVDTFDGNTVSGLPQGFDRGGSLLLRCGDQSIPIRYGEVRRTTGVAI
jgi:BirA family biotin operon repressor/biotin-[acetyl-CoA-carboxylase] ligase